METLFKKHDQYMANTPTEIIRDIMDEIHWDSRLIAIIGARGVGKSTLIRQFIKKNYPDMTDLSFTAPLILYIFPRIQFLIW